MQLQKEVKKEPNAKIRLNVIIGKSSVSEAREDIIRNFETHAKIPGFRKGKVPRNVIVSRFESSIKNETISALLSQSLEQVLKEEEFKPISDPVITEIGDLIAEEDFSYKAEFDVMPEVMLPEYRGVASEKYVYTVGNDLVNKELESLRERFATLESVDRPAKIGDYVLMDYAELDPNGKTRNSKKNQTIFLDDKDDQLAKKLVGLKRDDEKDITITQRYSEEGEEKEYTTELKVNVHDVKEKALPDLNDDFAKDISDAENLQELKKKVKEELEKEAERLAEEKTKAELLEKIIQKTNLELPESLIGTEVDRLLYEIVSAYRIDLKKLQKNEAQFAEYREKLKPRAMRNLKQEIVLSEIARKENVKLAEEELDEEIRAYAQRNKKSFDAVKNNMAENKSIDSLRYRLRLNKALEFLYKNARLEKVKKLKYEQDIEGGNA